MRCNVIDDVFNCAVLGHSRRTYAINPLKEASYLPFDFTASPFMKSKLQRDALKKFSPRLHVHQLSRRSHYHDANVSLSLGTEPIPRLPNNSCSPTE